MRNENRGYVGIWNEIGIYLIDIHEDSEKQGDKKVNGQQLGKERKNNVCYLIFTKEDVPLWKQEE